jgi:hypothetical protein
MLVEEKGGWAECGQYEPYEGGKHVAVGFGITRFGYSDVG